MLRRRQLIAAAGVTAAAAHIPNTQAQTVTSLRITHVLSPNEPANEACLLLAARITDRSQGKIKVEVFPQGQLGGNKEQYELMRQGANVMVLGDPSAIGDFVPDFGVLNGPYLLKQPQEFRKLLASQWYAELNARAQREQSIRVLTLGGFFGARHALSNKPLRTPNDFKGVAFRVPPTLMWIETFKALGTRPVTIPWPEIYSAMQQGVADAVEAPFASLWGMKLHETRKVLSLTGHFLSWIGWIMNERLWQRIPADLRAIIQEEADAAAAFMTTRTLEIDNEYIKRFQDAGVTVVRDLDYAALQKATESVYSAIPNWTPGLHARVKQILTS
jgi:tripartite ATP-independent transporter DctP family solute receptor